MPFGRFCLCRYRKSGEALLFLSQAPLSSLLIRDGEGKGGALSFPILGGGRRGLGGGRGGLALALEGEGGLGCGFVFS